MAIEVKHCLRENFWADCVGMIGRLMKKYENDDFASDLITKAITAIENYYYIINSNKENKNENNKIL